MHLGFSVQGRGRTRSRQLDGGMTFCSLQTRGKWGYALTKDGCKNSNNYTKQ